MIGLHRTNADDCDWIVAEKDAFMLTDWDGLGSHCYDSSNDAVTLPHQLH